MSRTATVPLLVALEFLCQKSQHDAGVEARIARAFRGRLSVLKIYEITGKSLLTARQSSPGPEYAVTTSPPRVRLGQTAYTVSENAAHYLSVLSSKYGDRMSDRDAVAASPFLAITFGNRPRLKELRDGLPPEVVSWLDSSNSGTKFRRPA